MSHGILELAVSGSVPLQLEYSRADVVLAQTGPAEAESHANYLNKTVEDEFSCFLELI